MNKPQISQITPVCIHHFVPVCCAKHQLANVELHANPVPLICTRAGRFIVAPVLLCARFGGSVSMRVETLRGRFPAKVGFELTQCAMPIILPAQPCIAQ